MDGANVADVIIVNTNSLINQLAKPGTLPFPEYDVGMWVGIILVKPLSFVRLSLTFDRQVYQTKAAIKVEGQRSLKKTKKLLKWKSGPDRISIARWTLFAQIMG